METPRKFKSSMFGYKKKVVNAYIMECAQKSQKTKTELEEKNKALEEQNKAFEEKIAVLEKERSYIADALLKAKQEAEKILSEAKLESERMRSGLELELEELRAKIRSEKTRINEIRADAKDTLAEYINRLNDIDIKAEDNEVEQECEIQQDDCEDDGESSSDEDNDFVLED